MKFSNFLLIVLCISFFSSCSSTKRITKTPIPKPESNIKHKSSLSEKEIRIYSDSDIYFQKFKKNNQNLNQYTINYIEKYKNIAISKMIDYKIPASITLAQGILESGNGLSELTLKANNHFGIKCHKGWEGKRVYHDDDKRNECFRKYSNPEGSFNDHSIFLTSRSRYDALFELKPDDYKGWAKGLKKAGYATDNKYPHKLISFIEMFNLYEFDDLVLNQKNHKKEKHNQRGKEKQSSSKYILVNKGDTLYSIARNNNLTVAKIKEINGLYSNDIDVGQKLYISD